MQHTKRILVIGDMSVPSLPNTLKKPGI
jgi:hypothetical protein